MFCISIVHWFYLHLNPDISNYWYLSLLMCTLSLDWACVCCTVHKGGGAPVSCTECQGGNTTFRFPVFKNGVLQNDFIDIINIKLVVACLCSILLQHGASSWLRYVCVCFCLGQTGEHLGLIEPWSHPRPPFLWAWWFKAGFVKGTIS